MDEFGIKSKLSLQAANRLKAGDMSIDRIVYLTPDQLEPRGSFR